MATAMSPTVLLKACENCRVRKIRCSRSMPCSNCDTAGLECRPSANNTTSTPRAPRQLPPNQYQEHIEEIFKRLCNIEAAIQSRPPVVNQADSNTSDCVSTPSLSAPSTAATPVLYEGNSSFTNQSLKARNFAEVVVRLESGFLPNSELSDTLNSLESLINHGRSLTVGNTFHFEERNLTTPPMKLAPVEFILRILNRSKSYQHFVFLTFSLTDDGILERLCKKVYFPTEPVTFAEMTLMHGLLSFYFYEFRKRKSEIDFDAEFSEYADLIEDNFCRALETYELVSVPSFEATFALLLGALKARDEAKTMLCWTLVSAAARHSQTLGYHREDTLTQETYEQENKRSIFWTIYELDKMLSLQVGRTSNLQDYDIDTKQFTLSQEAGIRPWSALNISHIQLSRLAGQVYEQLYSSFAKRKTPSERRVIVNELAIALEQWHTTYKQIDKTNAYLLKYLDECYGASDLYYYSILTLVHKSVSSSDTETEISSHCFEAAKRGLRSHLNYWPFFAASEFLMLEGYVNWIMHGCSAFVPFIVVFLHAIASRSSEDVGLLAETVDSLEQIRHVSDECEYLYQICEKILRVARALLDMRNFSIGIYNQQNQSIVFPRNTEPMQQGVARSLLDVNQDLLLQRENIEDVANYFGNWFGDFGPGTIS